MKEICLQILIVSDPQSLIRANNKLITMFVQYITASLQNPQHAWSKAGQRVQSLSQYNVQKQEGGREATGAALRALPSLFSRQPIHKHSVSVLGPQILSRLVR